LVHPEADQQNRSALSKLAGFASAAAHLFTRESLEFRINTASLTAFHHHRRRPTGTRTDRNVIRSTRRSVRALSSGVWKKRKGVLDAAPQAQAARKMAPALE
jgi:hypothetical protein